MLAPLLSLLLLLFTGCATHGNEALNTIEADWPSPTMTKAEIVARLGPPQMRSVSYTPTGSIETCSWSFAQANMNPALFVPVVGLFVAGSGHGVSGNSRAFSAAFAQDGTMISHSWADNKIGK